jgi:hypothetical protein
VQAGYEAGKLAKLSALAQQLDGAGTTIREKLAC